MEYFTNSPTKKLTAITMLLLIVITTTAVSGQSHCSLAGPVASGPCKDDYANCVANVITVLRDTTPHTEHMDYSTYYPADQPSGGVQGAAVCDIRNSFLECQTCLTAAEDWLHNNCADFSGGNYYDANTICVMTYVQVFR